MVSQLCLLSLLFDIQVPVPCFYFRVYTVSDSKEVLRGSQSESQSPECFIVIDCHRLSHCNCLSQSAVRLCVSVFVIYVLNFTCTVATHVPRIMLMMTLTGVSSARANSEFRSIDS